MHGKNSASICIRSAASLHPALCSWAQVSFTWASTTRCCELEQEYGHRTSVHCLLIEHKLALEIWTAHGAEDSGLISEGKDVARIFRAEEASRMFAVGGMIPCDDTSVGTGGGGVDAG